LKEFCQILLEERPKLNLKECENIQDQQLLQQIYSNNINEIMKYTSINPREAIKVLDSEGTTINEKIQQYIFNRSNELETLLLKLINELKTDEKESIFLFPRRPKPTLLVFGIRN